MYVIMKKEITKRREKSMRVIVLSDSHGRFDLLKRAAQQYPADLVIHLGDQ